MHKRARRGLVPDKIDGAFRGAIREAVASVELDGEMVVYDEDRQVVHQLNGTAAVIFSCLDGTASVDELVGELAAAYAVAPEAIREDVLGTVRQFGLKNLLIGVRAGPMPEEDARATPTGRTTRR